MASILAVDDEPALTTLLSVFLSAEGYWVRTAANGKEALSTLEHGSRPDLVLIDLCMPVMSGRAVIEAMRAKREWCDIPVVVLTASTPDSGLMPPPGTYSRLLHKPFDLDELLSVVRQCTAQELSYEMVASC